MFAYTTRIQLKRGQGEEGIRRWSASILPWLREQAGFRRAIVLDDVPNDRGMAILFWADRSDWEAAQNAFATLAAETLHLLIDQSGTNLHEGFTVRFDEG